MFCELALLAALALTAADVQPADAELPFHVVAHRDNPVSSITRPELSAIFMRRTTRWPDDSEIIPVDQLAQSDVRAHFSREIHQKSVAYVIRYWHRVIFGGRGIPPRELRSDAAVIEFVRDARGAIGYVTPDHAPDDDVKLIAVTP